LFLHPFLQVHRSAEVPDLRLVVMSASLSSSFSSIDLLRLGSAGAAMEALGPPGRSEVSRTFFKRLNSGVCRQSGS